MVLLVNSIKGLEIIPILDILFWKIEDEETHPNSFSEASITLIPKSEKDNSSIHQYPQINTETLNNK